MSFDYTILLNWWLLVLIATGILYYFLLKWLWAIFVKIPFLKPATERQKNVISIIFNYIGGIFVIFVAIIMMDFVIKISPRFIVLTESISSSTMIGAMGSLFTGGAAVNALFPMFILFAGLFSGMIMIASGLGWIITGHLGRKDKRTLASRIIEAR